MNINEEIKQKEFKSSFHKVLVNLMYTTKQLDDRQNAIFKKYGILMQHYNVLRIIRGNHPEPVSPGHIIDVMIDKGRDLTRLITKLVTLGLVTRERAEENKRKILISMTDLGLKTLGEIDEELYYFMSRASSCIADEDAEVVSEYLDKIRNGLR